METPNRPNLNYCCYIVHLFCTACKDEAIHTQGPYYRRRTLITQ